MHILDNTSGKEITLPDLPAGDLAQVRFSRDESRLALLVSSDTSPNDVVRSTSMPSTARPGMR